VLLGAHRVRPPLLPPDPAVRLHDVNVEVLAGPGGRDE